MLPPARACSARRSATSRAASSASATTVMSTALIGRSLLDELGETYFPPRERAGGERRSSAFCEFARAVHRGLDRVEERGAHPSLLELADRGDRRAAGRRNRLAQLDRMHALVAELFRRAEHRLHDERRRDLAGETEQDPRFDHRLG